MDIEQRISKLEQAVAQDGRIERVERIGIRLGMHHCAANPVTNYSHKVFRGSTCSNYDVALSWLMFSEILLYVAPISSNLFPYSAVTRPF